MSVFGDGRAFGGLYEDPAGAFEHDVEQTAGEASGSLDTPDVPVHIPLKGEDAVAVDRHPLVLKIDDHNLPRVLGEEEVAGAGGRHEPYAFAGEGLLEEAPQPTALVLEANVALVGDHRTELRLERLVVQPHL